MRGWCSSPAPYVGQILTGRFGGIVCDSLAILSAIVKHHGIGDCFCVRVFTRARENECVVSAVECVQGKGNLSEG